MVISQSYQPINTAHQKSSSKIKKLSLIFHDYGSSLYYIYLHSHPGSPFEDSVCPLFVKGTDNSVTIITEGDRTILCVIAFENKLSF